MKLKFIAAALGLVASASSFAAIDTGNTLVTGGELFLVVYEQGVAGKPDQSFTFDLGLSAQAFRAASGTSQTWATLTSTDAVWANFLATSDLASLQYSVIGVDGNKPTNILSTVTVGQENTIAGNISYSNVTTAIGVVNNYLLNVNTTGTHFTQANGESVNLVGSGAYFMDTTNALNNFNFVGWGNNNAVGTTSEFTQVTRAATGGLSLKAIETVQQGTVSFANTANGYVLSYNVAAVPEPEGLTLALAGFGIMGFLGARRRKQ
jgi:hypothetical protein